MGRYLFLWNAPVRAELRTIIGLAPWKSLMIYTGNADLVVGDEGNGDSRCIENLFKVDGNACLRGRG